MLYLFLLPVVWTQVSQYNETEARMMLLLSAGAYADTNNTAMNACVSAALPGDAATISDVAMENCDQLNNPCENYIVVTDSIRRLYVVFRGTKTDSQLILEGWSTLENGLDFYGMGLVNKYFKNGHELLWPAVQAVIGDPRYAGYGVTFTGHSLGGALAALAAARAASQGLVPGANIRLITFGEPRVGSAQFAQNFDNLISYSFRVVFRQDIVPHSPGCKKNKMVARLANGAEQCDPTVTDRPYHHGTEVWYPNSMLPGSNYTVCTGQPKNEDMNCSDQLTFSIGGNEKYIWDHRHYFAVRVPPFGQGGCDPKSPEGYGNNPSQKIWVTMRYKIFLLLLLFLVGPVEGQDSDEDDPAKAESNATGAIIIVSTAVFIIVLGMSFFGHRMKRSGIRWFTINGCVWGLVHMLYLSAYYDKAPWPQWFKSQMWINKSSTIATLMRCVFPVGAIGIMIEQIILTVNPRLQDRIIWQCFTAANFLIGHNLLIALVFAFEYSSKECANDEQALTNLWCFWYSPTEMLGFWSYGLFLVFTEIFLVLSIVSCCFCCWAMFMDPQGQRAPRTFNHPWLTLIWAHIPLVMYGPSLGMATFSFVMAKMMDWIISHGLISLVMGGGLGGGSSFLPSWFPKFDFSIITNIVSQFMLAMPWFITIFPLIQIVLTLFCFEMYREQMFHAISCGRLFHQKPKTVKERVRKRMYFAHTRPLKLIPVHQLYMQSYREKSSPQLQPLLQQNLRRLPVQSGPVQYQNSGPGAVTTQPPPTSSVPTRSTDPIRSLENGSVSGNGQLITFSSPQSVVLEPGVQAAPSVSMGHSLPPHPGPTNQFYGQPPVGQIPTHPLLDNNQSQLPPNPLQTSLSVSYEPSAPALGPRELDQTRGETPIIQRSPRQELTVLPQLYTPTGGVPRKEEGVRSDLLVLQDIIRNVPTQI